jgi:hypothetical protein
VQATHRYLHIDASGWRAGGEATPHLAALHTAVAQAQPVLLTYRRLSGAEIAVAVEPYGLVAKAGVWHLVYARSRRLHVIALAAVAAVQPLPGSFTRPAGVRPGALLDGVVCAQRTQPLHLPCRRAGRARAAPRPGAPLWVRGQLRLPRTRFVTTTAGSRSPWPLIRSRRPAASCSAFGGAVEVLDPLPLRRSLADFAAQVIRSTPDKVRG